MKLGTYKFILQELNLFSTLQPLYILDKCPILKDILWLFPSNPVLFYISLFQPLFLSNHVTRPKLKKKRKSLKLFLTMFTAYDSFLLNTYSFLLCASITSIQKPVSYILFVCLYHKLGGNMVYKSLHHFLFTS